MSKWTCEVVKDRKGTYCACMNIEGKYVEGLPMNVDYRTLKEAIRNKTGIEILKHKNMIFEGKGKEKYAVIDATQYRGEGKDCRVTYQDLLDGWKPKFTI